MFASIMEVFHFFGEVFAGIPPFVFSMYAFMFAIVVVIAVAKSFKD